MRGFRMTALALLIGAGVFLPAGAATAQRVVIDDGTADVWTAVVGPTVGWGGDYTADSSVPNVDVVRTTVSYTRTELQVTSKYVELENSGPEPELDTWLKLSDGGGVFLRASSDSMLFVTDKTARPGGQFERGRCPGAKVTFNLRADTGTVVLPVSCLPGDSGSVKFHGHALGWEDVARDTWNIWEDSAADASYYDNPINRSCFWKCKGWTKVRLN